MSVDQNVLHVLTVTGFSRNSFDEAVKHAIRGAWENHHDEFKRFVSFKVNEFQGEIGPELELRYSVTVAISAIHAEHEH
ncbi:MAG: dodecin domain-containing protein [Lentilitoribacter sp.]